MIRVLQELSKERRTSWSEWVAVIRENMVKWWQDTMPVCIRQEVHSLEAIEGLVQDLLQHCGQTLVTHWVTAQVQHSTGPAPTCPQCGTPMRYVSRHRPLHKLGWFGEYDWARPYWVCGAGHGGKAPADDVLGLGPEHLTPALARLVTEYAVNAPFDQVPEMVESALNLRVDGETVRRITERVGQQAELQEQDQITTVARGERKEGGDPGPQGPEALLVSVDGAMVQFCEDHAWHEVKVGVSVPLALSSSTGPAVRGVGMASPDYCLGLESRPDFWPRVYAHAVQQGLESPSCRLVALLGDGADWIWRYGAEYLSLPGKTLIEIVDIYHAREHLWAFATAQFGHGTAACTAWATPLNATLETQGVAPILEALAACPEEAARDPAEARTHVHYFHHQQTRMDYPRYARMGLPIGSGIVEGACKTVLKQRLTAGGMQWTRRGAQAVATLRALHRSHQWDAWWHTQPYGRTVQRIA